jgi:hypothetical protein
VALHTILLGAGVKVRWRRSYHHATCIMGNLNQEIMDFLQIDVRHVEALCEALPWKDILAQR